MGIMKNKKTTLTHNKHNNNKKKKKYKVRNWKEYNEALVQRGSINIWIDKKAMNKWYAEPTHKQGSPLTYSDLAIETALTVRKLFNLPLRSLEGFLISIFKQANVYLDVPDFSTYCRRGKNIKVYLNKSKKEKTQIIVDSSGVKVYGEGEWKVRKHGYSKHRTWKKIHIAIDEKGEIRAVDTTGNNSHDSEIAKSLLDQEDAKIEKFIGDGGYDTRSVYDLCDEKNISEVIVPPQKNAKIWQHGNSKKKPFARDENLRQIRKKSRKNWKIESDYHIRSLSENSFFRFKTIIGDRLRSRNQSSQKTEVMIAFNILNKMFSLGMPDSYAVTV